MGICRLDVVNEREKELCNISKSVVDKIAGTLQPFYYMTLYIAYINIDRVKQVYVQIVSLLVVEKTVFSFYKTSLKIYFFIILCVCKSERAF